MGGDSRGGGGGGFSKARLLLLVDWGPAVLAEVHSDRRSSEQDDERLDHQEVLVDQWVRSGGEGHGLGGLVVEHPPSLLEGHDQHFRPSRAMMRPTEFPARGFSKNPVFLF